MNPIAADNKFDSLEKEINLNSASVRGYPTIEVIFDPFKIFYEAKIQFQGVHVPLMHQIVPNIQYCIPELSRIGRGEPILFDRNRFVPPLLYSMHFVTFTKERLKKIEVHDLY